MARLLRSVFLSHASELREFPPGRTFVAVEARAGDAVSDMVCFAARDGMPPDCCQDAVRCSDLEVTSLERVARAVAFVVHAPALMDYPGPVHLRGDRVPRRLIEHLTRGDLTATWT